MHTISVPRKFCNFFKGKIIQNSEDLHPVVIVPKVVVCFWSQIGFECKQLTSKGSLGDIICKIYLFLMQSSESRPKYTPLPTSELPHVTFPKKSQLPFI